MEVFDGASAELMSFQICSLRLQGGVRGGKTTGGGRICSVATGSCCKWRHDGTAAHMGALPQHYSPDPGGAAGVCHRSCCHPHHEGVLLAYFQYGWLKTAEDVSRRCKGVLKWRLRGAESGVEHLYSLRMCGLMRSGVACRSAESLARVLRPSQRACKKGIRS